MLELRETYSGNFLDMLRYAATEGQFYSSDPERIGALFKLHEERIPDNSGAMEGVDALQAVILPHAGHVYSAYQTISFFKNARAFLEGIETVVLLHPNHHRYTPGIALDDHNGWKNCIGEVELDEELNMLLPYPKAGDAMLSEHSAEVLLPYLQYYMPHPFRILPICIAGASLMQLQELAADIQGSKEECGRKILLLASSDFSHFLSPEKGFEMDTLVIDKIEARDEKGLESIVQKNNISVCGYRPIIAAMNYAGLHDTDYRSRIIARGHSGEVHPSAKVVDYISIVLYS
jgi:AmmeMemoRadiSam system protein B